jgi:hypothetical protein
LDARGATLLHVRLTGGLGLSALNE